ncbi:PDDEXK nuclease domain-containing protein [Hydrogenimonas thermophila]|uniref:PDDEXK nuclease domain-containing protein n=1 Tax=Hydrogenimonas thermophila TaxID=223786 RepID=UPI0029372E42|nr:PDDEXK nuclease domain-containing protein [Hydrogenimonas thermophila]WOE69141.1 PDDEXK nuclease domain-containing protein [Hydrogenimonas thermophila]WOE71651.1 PDDEXK nuclease domain-containing protein [Hydrogenimonas thermophila]
MSDITSFVIEIKTLLNDARNRVYKNINEIMTKTYFEIGKKIVQEEQRGNRRADYGKNLLKNLSNELTKEFGKGFSVANLKNMRQFYLAFQNRQTVSSEFKLSYSHYIFLSRIQNENERDFYEIESVKNSWSLRELRRQFDSALYERLLLSKDKNQIKQLAKSGQVVEKPKDLIKDPYILEFVGLDEKSSYSESELEQRLIDKIEHFLLELGKGFTFVARQKRFTFDDEHFRIDLVFYNRLLRCFVLIDLKIGKLKHQDLGQMMMYVNYFDRCEKTEDENPTIGIILCKDKNDTLIELTLPKDSQIFASKYQTILPKKEDFKHLLMDNQDEN